MTEQIINDFVLGFSMLGMIVVPIITTLLVIHILTRKTNKPDENL